MPRTHREMVFDEFSGQRRKFKRFWRQHHGEVEMARYRGEGAGAHYRRNARFGYKEPTNPFPLGRRHDAWEEGYDLGLNHGEGY